MEKLQEKCFKPILQQSNWNCIKKFSYNFKNNIGLSTSLFMGEYFKKYDMFMIVTCTGRIRQGWVRPGTEPRWGSVAGGCCRTGSEVWRHTGRPRPASRQSAHPPTNYFNTCYKTNLQYILGRIYLFDSRMVNKVKCCLR